MSSEFKPLFITTLNVPLFGFGKTLISAVFNSCSKTDKEPSIHNSSVNVTICPPSSNPKSSSTDNIQSPPASSPYKVDKSPSGTKVPVNGDDPAVILGYKFWSLEFLLHSNDDE